MVHGQSSSRVLTSAGPGLGHPPLGSDFLVALPRLPAACSVSFEQRNVWDPPPWDPPGPLCWAGAAVMGVGSAAGCCGVPPIKGVIVGLARQRCSLIRGVQGFALQSSRI